MAKIPDEVKKLELPPVGPHKVRKALGATLPTGAYENIRINIEIEICCEDPVEGLKYADDFTKAVFASDYERARKYSKRQTGEHK